MPDTWKNISWPVSNAVTILINYAIRDSRALNDLRQYSKDMFKDQVTSLMDILEKGDAAQLKMQLLFDGLDRKYSAVIADMKVE